MSSLTDPHTKKDENSTTSLTTLQEQVEGILQVFGRSKRLGSLRNGIILSIVVFAVLGVYLLIDGRNKAASASVEPIDGELDVSETIEISGLSVDDLPAYSPQNQTILGITRKNEIETIFPERPRIEVMEYQVQSGDTLFGIAESFGLRPQTLLWGNYSVLQDNPHSLRPGQNLNILPVDGTYYEWRTGDNLETVAHFFSVSAQDLIDWPGNSLAQILDLNNPPIEPGTWLVVPGGVREFVTWSAPRITRSNPAVAKVAGPGACGSIYDGPIGEGYFIWPTTANILSGNDYTDYHPGIDIAGSIGNAIYAAASGVVVYAGWNNYGYGYMVVLDHGDGWQTLYAHMSQVNVVCGQAAFQGNVIGGVGSSGNSTGPHLHFEMQSDVYGKVNPYNFISP
jgi:murein DD-endopeptidase MepM/ murein hydrolase activator NlpD